NLTATVVTATQVNLAWTDNSANEAGFIIQRSGNDGRSWSQIATVAANGTSYSDTTAHKNQTYQYRVLAYNSFGNSAWSNVVTARTPNRNPVGNEEDQPVVWARPGGVPNDHANEAADANHAWMVDYPAAVWLAMSQR